MTRTRRRLAGFLVAAVTVLPGCSLDGLDAAHLPGGIDVGAHPVHVRIQFANVLDLVPGSYVKVNNVPVGEVESIRLNGWMAQVDVVIRSDVDLPANAVAQVLRTSLLGEEYVSLSRAPAGTAEGRLVDAATISLASSSTNPSVEEILGAMSLILTGGAFTQLQRIITQLNKALGGGGAAAARDLIGRVRTLAAQLDAQKAGLVTAIRSMNRLAANVAAQSGVLASSLQTLPPAVAVLDQQTSQLERMLGSLNDLSGVATRVVDAGSADFEAELRDLEPILTSLAAAGDALPNALKVAGTFPLPSTIATTVRGDYVNGNMSAPSALSNVLSDVMLHAASHNTVQQPNYAGAIDPRLPPVPGACGRPYPVASESGIGC